MFTVKIELAPATLQRFDRLMDFLEAPQQAQVDGFVARMNASKERLAAIIQATTPSSQQ